MSLQLSIHQAACYCDVSYFNVDAVVFCFAGNIRESEKHYSTVSFDIFWQKQSATILQLVFRFDEAEQVVYFSFTPSNEIAESNIAATICSGNFADCFENTTNSFCFDQSALPYKHLTFRHKHLYSLNPNALRKLPGTLVLPTFRD